ncbi:hypothetical protein [Neomegalonema perideroedes]|uniref:hypothetical protein n=1 Tax=Neomegalonema perideroedes TaxID=217219 RepID=UPI00036CB6BC|nr:hypothetical protein [Neomegalonema perideroedes]
MGHGPDASSEAQDAGARVFDCMLREADDLLEEAQAEWFLAADHPEAAREGLRAMGFLAAVGVWLAAMRSEPAARSRPGLSPILPPPRPKEEAEEPALERLKGVGARAARLYERAARLDGLLSGREEAAAVRTPEPMTARPARLSPPKRGIRTQAGAETRPAAGRAAAAEAGPDASPDARGRLIWLSEALAAEAWG